MSMIGSLLAFVVFPLKAKPKQPAPEAEAMTAALDHWRNAYAHLWRECERLRDERADARALSLRLMDERDALRRQLPARQAQLLAAYQAQAQQMFAQQHQAAQNPLAAQQAQQMLQNAVYQDFFCNCVPSREQAFNQPGHIFREDN